MKSLPGAQSDGLLTNAAAPDLRPREVEPTFASKMFQRPRGPALRVRATGSGLATCVLLHGYGEGGYVWDRIAPALACRYMLEIPDLRGHGESEWDPSGQYQMVDYVADIAAVIQALPRRPLALVGHSLGGDIATYVAARLPEFVDALILVDSGPITAPHASDEILRNLRESSRSFHAIDDFVQWLAPRRPLVSLKGLQHIATSALMQTEGGFRLRIDPALMQPGRSGKNDTDVALLWQALSRITCPTLVMRGEGTAVLSPSVAVRMAQTLRRGELATIRGAGHAVMEDNPEGFTSEALRFLHATLSSPRASATRIG